MSEYFRRYIKPEHYPVQPESIRFRTSFKNAILEALKRRTWREATTEEGWDLMWAEKEWVHEGFDRLRLQPHQKLNHFRNHYELTRKDMLIKNLKRFRKQLEREGRTAEVATMSFFPITYVLPKEYSLFVEEFKKFPNSVWIMKPIGKSQGSGIFLFNKLSQIASWKPDAPRKPDSPGTEPYIVQKYIHDPLLIGGKKFDLRIFALVTNYLPLTIYLYRTAFARFTNIRYSTNPEDICNTFMHLTNVAIQKTSDKYNEDTGGKWDIRNLKLYLISRYGREKVAKSFELIQDIIIYSIRSVQGVMMHNKHCFEMYGYDVLLDSSLKPWLIEVNGSPSMTANTPSDFEMKCDLLDDVLTIADMEKILTGEEEQIGGFDIIYKNGPIKTAPHHMFTTTLGFVNNRKKQLKKLAKQRAAKLAQQDPSKNRRPIVPAKK